MRYFIKCTGPQSAVCLRCGEKLNMTGKQIVGRCGHCGCEIQVEYAERVIVKEDAPKKKEWVQMELFH